MSENSNNKERISEKLSSEKANTKKKGILPVIIGIAAVIIVIVGVVIFTQGSSKSKDTSSKQRNIVVNPDNVDEVKKDLDKQKVETGTYEVTMNTTWEFEKGDSASTNAYVENSTRNKNAVYFDIVRTDTGDKIYESPTIPIGSHLEKITLDKTLEKGSYDCTLTYHLLDEKGNPTSKLNLSLMINVHK